MDFSRSFSPKGLSLSDLRGLKAHEEWLALSRMAGRRDTPDPYPIRTRFPKSQRLILIRFCLN